MLLMGSLMMQVDECNKSKEIHQSCNSALCASITLTTPRGHSWIFGILILRPRWIPLTPHTPVLPSGEASGPFLSFLKVFFAGARVTHPSPKTVPVLSSECPGVKFIPFTIDSSGGRPVFLPGLKCALRVSGESEAYAVLLNCFF